MQHVVLVGRCVPSFSVTNRRFFKAFLEPALFSVQGMAYARSGLRKTCRQRWVACLAGTSFPPLLWALCYLKHFPALGLSRPTGGILELISWINRA